MNIATTKISCVIITKNEERNIERCLKSVAEVVDEIIVVDSFSTDRTKEICEKYKVQFVQTEWKGYAETKNYGNSLVKFEYILSIDADEMLSDQLQTEIRSLKKSGELADGYLINRLTNYCGKWIRHCGWYPDRKLRLWRKDKGIWNGLIHETVDMSNDSVIKRLNKDILHYSYYSFNEHLVQMIRFTDLMAQNNVKKGKKVTLVKLLVSPTVKFIVAYFLRGGFLDGYYGFIICVLSSMATFLKYAKTYQLQHS